MARKARLQYEGSIHHVTFRGNARQDIFLDDADRIRLLGSVRERVEGYQVKLYLYCLMSNHVHLLVETPLGNLSAFMGSLLTSYTVYFNRRHRRVGHLTQGRYSSPVVEGDEYLLKLSRYVHLNPVQIKRMRKKELGERVKSLRGYRWSSYPGYAGLAKPDDFVSCGPILAMMHGPERERKKEYRRYVEGGLAGTDEEWLAMIKSPGLGIGSESFRHELARRYAGETRGRVKSEDVALRRVVGRIGVETVVEDVCQKYGIERSQLTVHRKRDRIKPITAALLQKWSGLTQRAIAEVLGVRTGVAVCLMLKKAREADLRKELDLFERKYNK